MCLWVPEETRRGISFPGAGVAGRWKSLHLAFGTQALVSARGASSSNGWGFSSRLHLLSVNTTWNNRFPVTASSCILHNPERFWNICDYELAKPHAYIEPSHYCLQSPLSSLCWMIQTQVITSHRLMSSSLLGVLFASSSGEHFPDLKLQEFPPSAHTHLPNIPPVALPGDPGHCCSQPFFVPSIICLCLCWLLVWLSLE